MKTIKLIILLLYIFTAYSDFSKYGRDEYELNGLRYHDTKTNTFLNLPLKNIKYKVNIDNNLAKVELSQYYENTFDFKIETDYYFPISPDATFDSFRAMIDDKTLIGEVKDKTEAKQEYQENLEAGNTVAYSDFDPNSPDIMNLKIGNLLPGQKLTIIYSYIEPVSIALNKYWRFINYATLTPRYSPEGSSGVNI